MMPPHSNSRFGFFWPSPPMQVLPLRITVRFYGLAIGKIGIGFIKKSEESLTRSATE